MYAACSVLPCLNQLFPLVSDPQESLLVARDMVHPSPKVTGEYKSKLNHLKQIGSIRNFSWHDKQQPDTGRRLGFKSTLTVELVHGGSRSFTNPFCYSSKQASQELTAKIAVDYFSKQPTTHSHRLVHKRDLNNLMVGKHQSELPTYTTIPVGQKFQCTVTHPRLKGVNGGVGQITGVGSSSKEAEDNAARRALDLLDPK